MPSFLIFSCQVSESFFWPGVWPLELSRPLLLLSSDDTGLALFPQVLTFSQPLEGKGV